MTDIERGRIGGGDEDRLPWLEPVEDETPDRGVGAGKLIAAVLVCLIAIGLVIGGVFWLRERGGAPETAQGDGDLIAAPVGDYKVAPTKPGGMNVEGEGDATFAASQGVPVDAAIDISKRPEAPVGAARAPEPVKTAKAEPVKTVPVKTVPLPPSTAAGPAVAPKPAVPKPIEVAKPAPAKPVEVAKAPAPKPAPPAKVAAPTKPATPASAGPAVQLGAFGTEAKAQAVWADLSGRFPALRSLSHSVSLTEVNGKKLYRLRAGAGSSGKAAAVCKALTSAKEACNVVG
jgi:cell division septation protein DedD